MSQVPDRSRRTNSGGKNMATDVAPSSSKRSPRRSRSRGPLIAAIVVLGVVGTAAGLTYKTLRGIQKPGQSIMAPLDAYRDPKAQFPGKDRVNVVLIGKDYNRDSKGMPFTKGSRADSIVILSLDLDNTKVSALSIPRDTRVSAPDGHTGKINGTYARGGAKLLMETIGQLTGVTPDYYVALKPDGVRNMVNSLGGVDVVAIDDMNYDDNWGQLHIHMVKGAHHITGDEAVGFTRFREIKPGTPHSKEEGDPRRMARQQMVIKAMAAQAKQPSNWLHLDKIINDGMSQVDTNLSQKQVFALGALFKGIQPDQIQSAALLGHGTPRGGGPYFFYPDTKKMEAMVDWLLKGDETAANRLTVVAVQNGTQIPGLARRVADVLRSQGGFDAKSDGNTPGQSATTGGVSETRIVFGKAAVEARAQRIAQLLGGGKLEKAAPAPTDSDKDGKSPAPSTDPNAPDVTVVLGKDLAANFAEKSAKL